MRIERTWTAWGTPATGSTLSDAIPVNDRRPSCPSTTRLSPGCGNLGAAASRLAVCRVVYIRARSPFRAPARAMVSDRCFLERGRYGYSGEAVNVTSAPVPRSGVPYSHDVQLSHPTRSRRFVQIGPR
jgi:hypothetical protein